VQPLGSFPAFYGTRRFITEFTRAPHLYLSRARQVQSTQHNPNSKISILMLSIHLRFGLPSSLFPAGFLTTNPCAFLFSLIRATCTAHLILLDLTILIDDNNNNNNNNNTRAMDASSQPNCCTRYTNNASSQIIL
jgi:hypothetical protein